MPRFLPQNTIPVSITNKSIIAQTYQKPDEGNRSVYFELSGPTPSQCYQVNIPNWNSNTQTGLSQICALRIDAAQLRWVEGTTNAAVPIATIFFPDSGDYIEISEDSYGIYPVITSGRTFYINFPSGGGFIAPALLAVTVLNFYEAPLKTNTGPLPIDLLQIGKTLVNGINGIPVFFNVSQSVNASDNIVQIGGSSANIANGRLPIDIQAQTLSSLEVIPPGANGVFVSGLGTPVTGIGTVVVVGGFTVFNYVNVSGYLIGGPAQSTTALQIIDNAGTQYWSTQVTLAPNQLLPFAEFVTWTGFRVGMNGMKLQANVFVGSLSGGGIILTAYATP